MAEIAVIGMITSSNSIVLVILLSSYKICHTYLNMLKIGSRIHMRVQIRICHDMLFYLVKILINVLKYLALFNILK